MRVSYNKIQREIANRHPMMAGLLCIDIDFRGGARVTDYGPATKREIDLAVAFVKKLNKLRDSQAKQIEKNMPMDIKERIGNE